MFIHKTILVRVVTEPLTHFLIIGILLFVGYEFTQQKPTMTGANNEIQISGIEVDSVKQIFRKRWQRDPEPTEIGPQIENLVREEVLYREALKLNMDQDIPVIRHCLATEFGVMAYSFEPALQPSDEVLKTYLEQHSENFRTELSYSFGQVFFGQHQQDTALAGEISNLIDRLNASGLMPNIQPPQGLLTDYTAITESQISRQFGEDFVVSLKATKIGRWSGPVASIHGMHIVRLQEATPASLPALDEIRATVENDWRTNTRRQHYDDWYQRLRANYLVTIESGDAFTAQEG